MEAYKVRDIICWNVDSSIGTYPGDSNICTYGKVLDISKKMNLIKIAYLHLKKPPDKETNWDKGSTIENFTNKYGYSPLDIIYKCSKLFKSENDITVICDQRKLAEALARPFINGPMCNCPTSQLMATGCSCGGL